MLVTRDHAFKLKIERMIQPRHQFKILSDSLTIIHLRQLLKFGEAGLLEPYLNLYRL
jgi:hypothetical protein